MRIGLVHIAEVVAGLTTGLLATSLLLPATGAAKQPTADLLSQSQQSQVIEALDSRCADTWCEGPHGFRFQTLRCPLFSEDTYQCRLEFEVYEVSFLLDGRKNPHGLAEVTLERSQRAACEFPNVRSILNLLNARTGGLSTPFEDQVDQCLRTVSKAFGARRE